MNKRKLKRFETFQTNFVCNCGYRLNVAITMEYGGVTCLNCNKDWYYDCDEIECMVRFAPRIVEESDRPNNIQKESLKKDKKNE